jgi:hypothetical protein
MRPPIKIIYKIQSLEDGTPVYRVYDKKQAQDILIKCQEHYPNKHFWLEEKTIDTSRSQSI